MDAESGRAIEPPRCAHCGDVIGVYEPVVVVLGDDIHLGSRASCPDPPPGAVLYHDECHKGRRPRP
jgi:hypothetical protein